MSTTTSSHSSSLNTTSVRRTALVAGVRQDILENQIISQIPVGRLGSPHEIGALVRFICSDDAGFMTGSNVAMNGGQHMY